MRRWRAEALAIFAGVGLLTGSVLVSALFGGPGAASIASAFLIDAAAALILVGFLVRIERRIVRRLEAAEEATREMSDAVEVLSEQVAEVMIELELDAPSVATKSNPQGASETHSADRPKSDAPAHRRTWIQPLAAVVLALAIAIALLAVALVHSAGNGREFSYDGLTRLAAERAGLGFEPLHASGPVEEIAFGPGKLWLLGGDRRTLTAMDTGTWKVEGKTTHLPAASGQPTVACGALWIPSEYEHVPAGGLERFDPQTGEQVGGALRFGPLPYSATRAHGSVWVLAEPLSRSGMELMRFDCSGRLLARRRLPEDSDQMTPVGSQLWVVAGGRILRLSATTGRPVATPISGDVLEMLRTGTEIFVIGSGADLEKIDPRSGSLENPVADAPEGCFNGVGGPRYLWLTCIEGTRYSLIRVDPRTGSLETIADDLTEDPRLSIRDGSLWLTDGSSTLLRLTPSAGTL